MSSRLWNLLPVPKQVNSAKSDKLPLREYFKDFGALQYDAFNRVLNKFSRQPKLLEDYSILFNDSLDDINRLSQRGFVATLQETIRPLLEIAENTGLEGDWKNIE